MDLTTTYLGLTLKNPIVAAASPLSHSVESMRTLEAAGASAIVMFSLFEEQIAHEEKELDHYLTAGTEAFAEALTYFPEPEAYHLGPEEYLGLIEKAKATLRIPIIASLNGITPGGWTKYAKKMEEAGADSIELNVYYIPADPRVTSADVENRYVEVLRAVKSSVKIPVAMKLSPYFSAISNFAQRLDNEGVDGLVLFNRFYQPDFDLDELDVLPNLQLSTTMEMRLPLRWIAILCGHVKASLAATSGIYNAEDVLKTLMAGADVAMLASSLLKFGPRHLEILLRNLERWLADHEYVSVAQLKGSMSQKAVADPSSFERANYMKVLQAFRK